MSSINWNDLNDSSQLSQASSDQAQKKTKVDQNKNPDPPVLQKAISSPEQTSKPINSDNQLKTSQNLEKLSKHKDAKVWLYINDYFANRQNAQQILKGIQDFEKVIPTGKGWNVQLKTQIASKYIQKGHYQKGINIKFIYSTKNEQKQSKQSKQPKRVEKKYSEKYSEVKYYEQRPEIISPKIKSKQTFNQKTNYQREKDQERQKKKIKYVAKDSIQKKFEQQKYPRKPKFEQIKQQPKSTEIQIDQSPKKQEKLEKNTTNGVKQAQKNQKPKELQKQNEQQKKEKEKNNIQNKTLQKQQKSENQQSQSEKQERQAKRRQKQRERQKEEKKKKKKIKNSKSSGFHDPNNPFSSFA